jgi:mono/diheme cytochrome c family protein
VFSNLIKPTPAMSYKIIFSIIVLLAIFAACSNNNSLSDATGPPPIKTGKVVAGEDKGKNLFEAKCAACHGSDGTAGIANAANLQISRSDSTATIQTLLNGKGAMPSFKSQLTEEEIHKLTNYLFSLRK